MAGELDFGALGAEGQVEAPEQAVVAEGDAAVAEICAIDGDASSAEPAQQANHQHHEGFFAQATDVVVGRAGLQADDCAFAA